MKYMNMRCIYNSNSHRCKILHHGNDDTCAGCSFFADSKEWYIDKKTRYPVPRGMTLKEHLTQIGCTNRVGSDQYRRK